MISLASALPENLPTSYLTCEISCLYEGFKGSALEPDLWIQGEDKTEALILKYGANVYIAYLGGDMAEIEEFLNILGTKEIITDTHLPFLKPHKENYVFKKEGNGKALPLPEIPSLIKLYETLALSIGEDISLPDFDTFAPDTSHLLRHGFAFSLCEEQAAALVRTVDGVGVLKGIAVNEVLRGKGAGSRLLSACLSYCPCGLYAATKSSGRFYEKNGFVKEPYRLYYGVIK